MERGKVYSIFLVTEVCSSAWKVGLNLYLHVSITFKKMAGWMGEVYAMEPMVHSVVVFIVFCASSGHYTPIIRSKLITPVYFKLMAKKFEQILHFWH